MATGKVTRIADLPPFRVGDVFPADQKSAALVRFIVTTRPLVSIARLLSARSSDPALARVDGDQMMLAATADTKEAMDAFRDADTQGCFGPTEARADDELKKRLRRLRRHSDRTSARSLYNVMIETARNNAGGHWNRRVVQDELEFLKDEKVAIWEGDKAAGMVLSGFVPLAHGMALRMSRIFDVSEQKQARRMILLSKVQGDLFHVAEAAYTIAIRSAYAKKQWT